MTKCQKPYWNDTLDRLKESCMDMHNLWRSIGSPKQGVVNHARLTAKLDYKRAIKQAANDFDKGHADELYQTT